MSWTLALVGSIIIGVFTWYVLRKSKPDFNSTEVNPESLGHLHIYVGTQTDHAMSLAETLSKEAKNYHFSPHIIRLENFQILDFKKHDFCVLICSTQPDGTPPENALKFLKWLTKSASSSNENLANLSYSVFGLTKKSNNNTAIKIIENLESLGAIELVKSGCSDENDFSAFQKWMSELWKVLPGQVKSSRRTAVKDTEYLEVALQVPLAKPNQKIQYEKATNTYLSSKDMKITKIKELKRDPEFSALNVEIAQGCPYETGGKIGIFPENDEEIVREIAAIQGYDLELSFQFVATNKQHPFPTPITTHEALVKYCDLTSLLRKKTLKKLAHFAQSPEEHAKISTLSSLKGNDEFKRKLQEPMLTVADFLKLFPSIRIPIGVLVQILDRIEPRYYHIASSYKNSPENIQIAVEVLRERTCEGKVRTGLCSGYLEKMHVTGLYKNIKAFCVNSKFKLPSSPSVIHMICNRCGISAFKGILLELKEQYLTGNESHQIILYLGCKSKSTQFIYKEYIEKLIAPNDSKALEFQYLPENYGQGPFIIKQMFAAFSKDQTQKRTLRDILFTRQENIWESIYKYNGCVMVSGSAAMGKRVKECIMNIASEHLGEEAGKFLERLAGQNKFIEEVWN